MKYAYYRDAFFYNEYLNKFRSARDLPLERTMDGYVVQGGVFYICCRSVCPPKPIYLSKEDQQHGRFCPYCSSEFCMDCRFLVGAMVVWIGHPFQSQSITMRRIELPASVIVSKYGSKYHINATCEGLESATSFQSKELCKICRGAWCSSLVGH